MNDFNWDLGSDSAPSSNDGRCSAANKSLKSANRGSKLSSKPQNVEVIVAEEPQTKSIEGEKVEIEAPD